MIKSLISASVVLICCVSCATSGSNASRALAHTYQDKHGLTMITMLDKGEYALSRKRVIGDGVVTRDITIPIKDFEGLWNRLDESKLAPYEVKDDFEEFNTLHNYVVTKGSVPGARHLLKTYVVPRSKASPALKDWARSIRAANGA